MALETIFHGQPSGIDHTVIIGAQPIAFVRKGKDAHYWPLLLRSDLHFVIALAGPHDGTKNALKELAERKKRHEQSYTHIINGLDGMANEMEHALLKGHIASVGELMNIAQGYLNALSLSTSHIETLCAIAREQGALGAKLTGAGGGGAVIALCDGCEKRVLGAFKAAGYQSFITTVSAKTEQRNA
jgi:hydroxymethylglutaryl-CoA reductase